jgi:hypothetical protein
MASTDASPAVRVQLTPVPNSIPTVRCDIITDVQKPSYFPKPIRLPLLHEVFTATTSLAAVVTGKPEAATAIVDGWKKESVIGSGVMAAHSRYRGDEAGASEYARGFRRATGRALMGGGLFNEVPLFHELSTTGESLADVLGDGDTDSARQHWEEYSETSVIGTGARALHAHVREDTTEAERLRANLKQASRKAVIQGAAAAANVGVMVATCGAAFPVVAASVVTTQVASDVTANAVEQYMTTGDAPVVQEFAGDVQQGLQRVGPLAMGAAAAAAEASAPVIETSKEQVGKGVQAAAEAAAPSATAAWEAGRQQVQHVYDAYAAPVMTAPVVSRGVEDGNWAVEAYGTQGPHSAHTPALHCLLSSHRRPRCTVRAAG